jgi:nicotinamide riboside kinase
MKTTSEILKEFDEKFHSPKTLWAQNKNGIWKNKSDVEDFIRQSINKVLDSIPSEEIVIMQNREWKERYSQAMQWNEGYNQHCEEVRKYKELIRK